MQLKIICDYYSDVLIKYWSRTKDYQDILMLVDNYLDSLQGWLKFIVQYCIYLKDNLIQNVIREIWIQIIYNFIFIEDTDALTECVF